MVSVEELVQSLTPGPGEARVFVLDPVHPLAAVIRDAASEEDRSRCSAIREPATALAALTGAGMLRLGAAGLMNCPIDDVRLGRDRLGRVRIEGASGDEIDLNMSRRPGCVAVVVSHGGRCGIDIEHVHKGEQHTQILEALRAYGLEVDESSCSDSVYARWCVREAVLKADGRGLSQGLDGLEQLDSAMDREKWRCGPKTWDVRTIPVPDGFVGAVALGEGLRLQYLSICDEGMQLTGCV